jgi:hypothetical protein
MGIDFSHCDAHWAYSGFDRFRTRLAAQIGIDLDKMEGFGGRQSWLHIVDPIKGLLDHSDCDGELTAEQCRTIAPRLRELVAGWQEEDRDKQMALELAKGLEAAASSDESLQFT